MSLPTIALFVKNNRIVGSASANVGWFFDIDGLYACIKQGMDDAWERYRDGWVASKWSASQDKYFTTSDDLKTFEYMVLYYYAIDSQIAYDIYNKKITVDEFEQLVKDLAGVREFTYDEKNKLLETIK